MNLNFDVYAMLCLENNVEVTHFLGMYVPFSSTNELRLMFDATKLIFFVKILSTSSDNSNWQTSRGSLQLHSNKTKLLHLF